MSRSDQSILHEQVYHSLVIVPSADLHFMGVSDIRPSIFRTMTSMPRHSAFNSHLLQYRNHPVYWDVSNSLSRQKMSSLVVFVMIRVSYHSASLSDVEHEPGDRTEHVKFWVVVP